MWPSVVPSFEGVQYARGRWPVDGTRSVHLDSTRDDLGREGFELIVSASEAVIIAASQAGADYGQDALENLVRVAKLAEENSLDCGRVISTPFYRERGVTLSASTLVFSRPFLTELLRLMRSLRLNQLLLEVNIAEKGSQWPYWRAEEVRWIVEQARINHIEVIPQVNAPSHMETYLRHVPEMALVRDGKPDLERLDFTRPQALEFYMAMVDKYADVFTSSLWHMGADEFEHAGVTFDDFPQIRERAQELLGADAQPQDLYVHFINEVAQQLAQRGKRLRIWNDSLKPTKVALAQDIVVEYWQDRGYRVGELLDAGFEVLNVSEHLYWSRSEMMCMDPEEKYVTRTVDSFATGEQVYHSNVLGLRASIWPDRAWIQTENEVIEEVRPGLSLVAQNGWSHTYPWPQWSDALQVIDQVVVQEQPELPAFLSNRIWEIPALSGIGETWRFLPTPDGYFRLQRVTDSKLLSLRSGRCMLGVIMEEGAELELRDDVDPSGVEAAAATRHTFSEIPPAQDGKPWNQTIREVESELYEYNCQKWQVTVAGEPSGTNEATNEARVIIRAALSQLELSEDESGVQVRAPEGKTIDLKLVKELP
ncbi:family 20 glycosylhydrolase [Actinomyces urinae]|uniref:family 20 glycosylhydrolase n=1 Tax=Actinomyces urinae TaxID=1689268 RepID=UPI000930E8D1|nr:family 20 glycosylhydrolase [Actinomyces urinae]